jgi:ATP-binding cassette, subfamily B, multidrug efflux pump
MSPARRLLVYIWRHRRAFLLGFLCVLGSTSISLTAPWVLKLAIDDLMAAVTIDKVRTYAAAIVALAVGGGIFRFLVRRIIVGASRDFEYDLRNDFFAHLQRLDLAYFQRSRTGDLMSRATNDLNAVRMMVGPAVMYTATTGLTFIVATMMMLSIDARLALISLIPLPFVSLSVWYFGNAIHRRFERIQEQLSEISAVTQESLAGVRVVRVYRQEPFEIERFRKANAEYVDRNRTLIQLQGVYYPSMGLLIGIGALLVLWLGGREVVSGRITVGELVAFNAYLAMLGWPMIAFGWVTNLLQRGMASWKRMLEVMDVVPAVQDDPASDAWTAAGRRTSIDGDIEFRDVTLSFGGHNVLDNVSFTIPCGTTTAIVGPTGSGKSSLLALLPRLHDAHHGSVLIDGVDVRRIPLATLRGAIGFVPQDPLLFSATIGENVALGLAAPGVSRGAEDLPVRGHEEAGPQSRVERITWAARIAQLDKDVADFPNGFDTIVGERGITLSGGQKQRTALARALAIDPRILVLDDALSAVDTATEEEILRGLGTVMSGRTSIVVSHRVSTVRGADQILVLDAGRIVERGTHEELVRRGGFYSELYRKQLLEEELAAS